MQHLHLGDEPLSATGSSLAEPDRHPSIERYLDRVCAHLQASPEERTRELRAELAQHLDALVAAHQELGRDGEAAVREALRQFGSPDALGRNWARQWRRSIRREATTLELLAAATVFAWCGGTFGIVGWVPFSTVLQLSPLQTALAGPVVPILVGLAWGRRHRANAPDRLRPLALITGLSLLFSGLIIALGGLSPDPAWLWQISAATSRGSFALPGFATQELLAQLMLWQITTLSVAGLTTCVRRLLGRTATRAIARA